jgi:hypothetical protein
MNNKTTVSKFDQHHFEGHPPPSTLVIHIFGFAIIEIVRFDPKEARQGDLAIGVTLSRFFIKTSLWLKLHKMTRDGSSSTPTTPSSSTYLNGLIIRNERSRKIHENLNSILRLGDIWLLVDPPLLGGCAKFFKLEHSNEFKEGDRIVRVELFGVTACVLSWRLCKSGDRILRWVYASVDEISFSIRIEGNQFLTIEIEEECRLNFVEI